MSKFMDEAEAVFGSESSTFVELVQKTSLDPTSDFKKCDLRGCNLRNQDLRQFDFTGSVLFGAEIKGAVFNVVSLKGALLFEFERNFPENVVLAGRLFLLSRKYYEREISLVALLALGKTNEAQSYMKYQKIREKSSRVMDAITRAERIIGEGNSKFVAIDLANYVTGRVRTGYPLARYKYRQAIGEVNRLFPEVKSILPSY
jgi:uncharacterized protein YjbI with pentapeptide repeats